MHFHHTVLSTFCRLKSFQNNMLEKRNKIEEQNCVLVTKQRRITTSLFALSPLNCHFWLIVKNKQRAEPNYRLSLTCTPSFPASLQRTRRLTISSCKIAADLGQNVEDPSFSSFFLRLYQTRTKSYKE